MICPDCKCEYIPGVRECADCGVALVDQLESSASPSHEDYGLVSVWRGDDPAKFELLKKALERADIPFTVEPAKAYFILPSKFELWVHYVDRAKARKTLLDLEERIDPTQLSEDEIASLALPIPHDEDESTEEEVPDDIPEEWDDEMIVSEVWNGEQEDFADSLRVCLRENGIPSQKLVEASVWHIVVPAPQESRAKEIVRQVVDASPPQ